MICSSAQAIEQHCKAGPGGGYSGLRNVYSKDPQQDDVQVIQCQY